MKSHQPKMGRSLFSLMLIVIGFHTQTIASDAPLHQSASQLPSGIFASGASHLCILSGSKDAVCWGSNGRTGQAEPPAIKFSQVAAGGRQSMGLTESGQLHCWGQYKELCPSNKPFTVVDAGYYHACGLSQAGTISCWGDTEKANSELLKPPSGQFASLTNGWFHACALSAEGK